MATGAPAPALAPARVPTPRPKAPATTSAGPETSTASGPGSTATGPTPTTPASKLRSSETPPPPSRSGTPRPNGLSQPGARRGPRAAPSDPLSDRVTAHLIRRVLCPDRQLDKVKNATPVPIEDLLPPLTSRNDVDLQLYALIAIILREYVQKWYSKITPDETFVAETVQIIAHCTRALEQRLRKVDLESLLFDEIPDLLDRHVTTYRAAHSSIAQPPIQTDPRDIYHSMWPLPALSPVPKAGAPTAVAEQAENEAAYRQLLVQGVLALLLPTEDLENGCLTSLVGQIFSELIIGNVVANKLAEPWMLWEVLIILCNVIRRPTKAPATQQSTAGQSSADPQPTSAARTVTIHGLFLSLLSWCFFAANLVRVVVTVVFSAGSLPRRTRYHNNTPLRGGGGARHGDEMTRQKAAAKATHPARPPLETRDDDGPVKVPIVAFRLWAALSNLVEMDRRMPWLCGATSLLQWIAMTGPGRIADVDGVLDRLLSHSVVQARVLDPAGLPPLLRSVRGALFPNNAPGTSTLRAPSSQAELGALRRKCARAVWSLVPRPLAAVYFRGGLVARQHQQQQQQQGDPDRSRRGGCSGGVPGPAAITPPSRKDDPVGQYQPSVEAAGGGASMEDRGQGTPTTLGREEVGRGGARQLVDPGPGRSGPEDSASHGAGPPTDLANADDSGGGGGGGDMAGVDEEEEEERILAEIEEGVLDVFGDAYCNKHLMYSVLELVLVRLMPELAGKGVVELWEERLE